MIEDTPEQKEVIRERQRLCKHDFIRGACDKTPRCVHCGISQADAEQMTPYVGTAVGFNWAPP